MPTDTFQCPHCGAVLKKSAAAYIAGEMEQGFINMAETTPCPACGKDIDSAKMVKGDYDYKDKRILGCAILMLAAMVAVVGYILFSIFGH